jgi:ABC-type lipoprotein export system ATPase subunit
MSEVASHPAAAPSGAGARTSGVPLLRAVDLSKTYRMGRVDVPVLKGATLEVEEGEWVAVLGASGSGKSTLLHLMGDLDRPDSNGGDLYFDGHSVSSMSRRERNRYRNLDVGFVFQFYHLLPELNVMENTLLPALVGLGRVGYYAARARLREQARSLLDPFGLGERLDHRPRELSGGERQRVAIARALMNDPKVLLADEPTGNLDESTGGEILDLLAKQHRDGLTIVMVTHDTSIAKRADRVVELHGGRVTQH